MSEPASPTSRRQRRDLAAVGTDPDYRYSFANERTFLAWIRTSLALVAAGVAVIELVPEDKADVGSYLVGLPLIALGTVLPLVSLRRWADNERAMRLGETLPRTRIRVVLVWWIMATMVLAGATVLIREAS